MTFTKEELQEFESMITLEVAYIGNIDEKMDNGIEDGIPAILEDLGITAEWYFSESSLGIPSHRIIGFELDKPLSYEDKIEFNLGVKHIYNGSVLIVQI